MKKDELTSHQAQLTVFFLEALDFRAQHPEVSWFPLPQILNIPPKSKRKTSHVTCCTCQNYLESDIRTLANTSALWFSEWSGRSWENRKLYHWLPGSYGCKTFWSHIQTSVFQGKLSSSTSPLSSYKLWDLYNKLLLLYLSSYLIGLRQRMPQRTDYWHFTTWPIASLKNWKGFSLCSLAT